ncbi:MAG: hypothetical protein ACK2UA_01315 [Anaerolineae bacterium]|jgi:hypothetical protein
MYQQYPQYPQQQPVYYQPAQQYGGCLKALLYILAFTMPLPAGIIIAIIFLSRQDPESKSLGNACLIVSIVALVIQCCLTIAAIVAWPTLIVFLDSMSY